ncbi:MAG: cbb3-type cytochrome c oxidase N-terminal domain-containing protein [Chitinophagaceae bacterium]|jgi:cytochrome c oxidase cbb3-type subunit 3
MSIKKYTSKLLSIGILLMMVSTGKVFAQETAAPKDDTNLLQLTMIITAIVLVGVIWLLSQVMITLSKSILKKRKGDGSIKTLIILIGTSLLSSVARAQESYIISGMANEGNYGGMSFMSFYALIGVITIELIVIVYFSIMIRRLFRDLSGEADKALARAEEPSKLLKWWNELDKKWMTRAVPVEKEADVLLDHDYDGIKELDNALPPWWKYGFYITIVIGIIYLFNFHVWGTGKNPDQEYADQMAEGLRLEEQYKARTKDIVDENNLTLSDAEGIAAGKALFTQSCVACHAADGGGGIGPNLTDKYWIHGGKLNEVYKTIKIGYPEKGMQSWQSMYSPLQMKNLASFVKSLQGAKTANPKEPQGDLMQDEMQANNIDSTKAATK